MDSDLYVESMFGESVKSEFCECVRSDGVRSESGYGGEGICHGRCPGDE